jgi:hypothetical protein
MLVKTLIGLGLVAITVAVHAWGLSALLRPLMRSQAVLPSRFWPISWLLIRVTWLLLLIHLIEIAVWALFYLWAGLLPDAESAFYFSGVTYATVGYGDVVLQSPWRMLGPVEGLTGILMCGLSTGLFFAVLSRVVGSSGTASIGEGRP